MASNREERRLGRQRGTAKHQVQDVDFGTPFQTAPVLQQRTTRSGTTPQQDAGREGRRLGRQRGAGKHQVQDVEFGTPFQTAPVPPKPTTRNGTTPQQESQQGSTPRLPARRTPSKGSGGPTNIISTQKRTTPTLAPNAINANTESKRRKLDATQENRTSSSARSTRSRTTPRGDLYDLPEEEPRPESGRATFQTPLSSRLTEGDPFGEDEITESPKMDPGSGQRQQANVQLANEAHDGITSAIGGLGDSGRNLTPNGAQKIDASGSGRSLRLPSSRRSRNIPALAGVDEVDELSPDRTAGLYLSPDQGQFSDDEGEAQDDFDDIADIEAAQDILEQVQLAGEDELEWEAEQAEFDDNARQRDLKPDDDLPSGRVKQPVKGKKARTKASPATQRQPKKPKPKPAKDKIATKSGGTIPVVVHRLTRPFHHGEDDTDADLLNEDIPFAKRSGVNAVDVLSQFCEEVIESGLEALEEGGSNAEDGATRREYRTKLRAVEAFQEELRTRLLELTITLDTSYSLKRRVRAAQKSKIQLRDNLLHLRTRREQIALRMDEVRIKHERDSKVAQDQQLLSTSLHDIELAVSRALEHAPREGEEQALQSPDLASRLGALANGVSSRSKEGGILRRVREFNNFLERAAGALESKGS